MAKTIEARVKQKKDTLSNWIANPMKLLDGEQVFVVGDTGQPINFKIGDGTKTFAELPFWIQYDQAAFVPVTGLALPTPTEPVGYSILGEGTYTHVSGGFTVPTGHWGVANWDGSAWGFSDMGELPTTPLTNTVDQTTDKGITPKGVDDALTAQRTEIDTELSPLFDIYQSYNLFDRANRLYNDRLLNTTGTKGIVTASGWNIAIIPIPDAGHYTIQGWDSARYEMAFFSGAIPDPMPASYDSNIVVSGDTYTLFGRGKVGGVFTFTKPSGGVTFMVITVANATEADSVFASLQVVKGSQALPYQPYGQIKQLKQSLIPQKQIKEIKLNAGILQMRTKFNNTVDLVRSISLTGGSNGATNLLGSKLIGSNNNIDTAGVNIHTITDSVPSPLQVNVSTISTYLNVGGNHGIKSVADITATAHGKTSSDLLSTWSDALGDEFYLGNIIDANTLRMVAKPKNIGGFDKIKETPVSPLTHVSGATNTANIVFSAGAAFEFKPAIRSISVKVSLDGREISDNGTYSGDVIKVVDTHLIADPTQPTLTNPYSATNNGVMVQRVLTHTFYGNGSYTAEDSIDSRKNHTYTNIGTIQPEPLLKGAYTGHMMYIPNVGVIAGHDLDNGVDLSGTISGFTVLSGNLKDNTKKTNMMSQILSDSGGKKVGFGAGLNTTVGAGKSPGNSRIYFPNFKKYYPRGFTGNSNTDIIRVVGYFAYWDATRNPKLTHDYFYYYGGYKFYCLMVGTALSKEVIKLDEVLRNQPFSIVEQSSALNIHTQDFTNNDGLIVSGAVGEWAVIKIG